MKPLEYHPLLHRFAVLTLILALLPIIMGALVTTYNAGMAFLDWPSSDGHNMFFYPWLKSAGDKFIEHGHRLAGALIGFVSIGLAAVAWKTESRKSVRWAATGVLLGGHRPGAFGRRAGAFGCPHAGDGARQFRGVGVRTDGLGRRRHQPVLDGRLSEPIAKREIDAAPLRLLSVLTWVSCVAIFLQYLAGGLVRHFGSGSPRTFGRGDFGDGLRHRHGDRFFRSKVPALKRAGWLLFACLILQVGLGLGTWVMKFGFAPWGYVAVADSLPQVLLRTAHTVSGMLLFAAAVTLKLKTRHVRFRRSDRQETRSRCCPPFPMRP